MTDYMLESLTEIIIAYGAQSLPLDPELREIGGIVIGERTEIGRLSEYDATDFSRS